MADSPNTSAATTPTRVAFGCGVLVGMALMAVLLLPALVLR